MISLFLTWYLLSSLVNVAGLPFTFSLFRRLPGKGYAFARILGCLLVGYLTWLLGVFGLLRNDTAGWWLAFLATFVIGYGWLRKDGFRELGAWLRTEWKMVLGVEVVFLVLFAGWTIIRAYNPEILGTEKPMEFMFLNAILRSPSWPPLDAWLSDHAISYYYFGYWLAAGLTRLTGTPSAVAYNLVQALWFSLVGTGSLGIALELITLSRGHLAETTGGQSNRLRKSFGPALLAPLFVLLVGNLYGALGLAHANGLGKELRLPAMYFQFVETGEQGQADKTAGLRAGMVPFWEWLDLKRLTPAPAARPATRQWGLDNWFFAARVVHDRSLTGEEVEAIDENPAFSFLLGDLHPHVLALPFVLLGLGLCLEGLLWMKTDWSPGCRWFLGSPARGVLASLVLGSLLALNTWDFPVYAFLFGVCACLGFGWQSEGRQNRQMWFRLGIHLVGVIGLAFVLYLPFFLTFQSQAGGVLPNIIFPTRFQQLLVMFAPVLTPVAIFIAWLRRHGRSYYRQGWAWISGLGLFLGLILVSALLAWGISQVPAALPHINRLLAPFSVGEALPLIIQRRLVDSLTALSMATIIGVSVGLGIGFWQELKKEKDSTLLSPPVFFSLAVILTGALLVLGPEFVYLRDNFGTRMNTLFKFYFQAWALWGLAGAFGVWYVWQHGSRFARWVMAMSTAGVVLLGLVYLPAGFWSKTGGFTAQPTLDGMAYFARQYPADMAAIRWLEANAQNGDVVLEGSRGAYWVEGRSSRLSMATGLPTVLGWVNHEAQWRGNYFSQVADRLSDLETIYTSRDWETTRALLDRYRVEFIVVSDLEKGWYKPLFEAKFKEHLLPVFRSGDLTIYRNEQ